MFTGRRARILVLTFLHFFVDFYAGLLPPLAEPTLTEHLGTTLGWVMIVLGIGGIVVNAIQPISAALLPKKGFPPLLIIAPALACIISLIGFSTSIAVFAALTIAAYAGIGVLHPEGILMAQALSGSRQGVGTAVFISGGFLGYSFGGWVGGAWASQWKLAGFWLLGIPVVIGVVLVLVTKLHRYEADTKNSTPSHIRHSIPFAWVLALTICVTISVTLVAYLITPYLVRRFGPRGQYWGGTEILTFGIAGAIGSYLWGHIAEHRSKCRMIIITQAASLPFFYLLLNASSPEIVPLWGGFLGFFTGAIFPTIVVLGRGSPGEATRLRAGLLIGGTWGTGMIAVIAAGKFWIDRFPPTAALPVAQVMYLCPALVTVSIFLAAFLRRWETQTCDV